MGRILLRGILCAIGGLVGWILTEPMLPNNPLDPAWNRAEFMMVVACLLGIGLLGGLHQGLIRGGSRNIGLGIALGAVFALTCGLVAYNLAGVIASAVWGQSWATSGNLSAVLPRTFVFAFLGLGAGAGVGIAQRSLRGVMSGAFGGLIGGGASGMIFDVIGMSLGSVAAAATGGAEAGSIGRAIFWPMMGLCIGIFTALIEQATRQAWVRLVLGRNEGKEWAIDHSQTNIGRDERAHVPLFGDTNVAPLHATIVKNGSQYILHDAGTPLGVGYQGVRISAPVILNPGDTFQIGQHQLQFLMKGAAAARAGEGRQQAMMTGAPMMPQGQPQAAPMQPIAIPGAGVNPGVSPATVAMPAAQNQNPTVAMAQPQASGFALVATTGPLSGQRFAVASSLDVGRDAPGLPLGFDNQASRRHANVAPMPSGLQIQDLGSTNGTFVNGQRVQTVVAQPGDTVTIGSTTFRVERT